MKSILRSFSFLCFALLLNACGQDASTKASEEDEIQTQAPITFVGTDKIEITAEGAYVESQVISPTICQTSIPKTTMSYELKSATELQLGDSTYEKVADLATPSSVAGVDSRIFAVWREVLTENEKVKDGIILTPFLEIQSSTLIFRLNCVQ